MLMSVEKGILAKLDTKAIADWVLKPAQASFT